MKQGIIKCEVHDYVEIACLYSIEIKLTFKDGSQQIVTPINTTIDSERFETMEVRKRDQTNIECVRLNSIAKMSAIFANPHFNDVYFE